MLPDVPPRIADDAIDEICYYKNAFTGAATVVEYRRNEVKNEVPLSRGNFFSKVEGTKM